MRRNVFVLIIVMLLCLNACSSENAQTPTTTLSPESTTQTTAPVPTTTQPKELDHTSTDVYLENKWFDKVPAAAIKGVTEDIKVFHIAPTEDQFRVMQGCCTDGKYMYAILEKKNQDVDGESRSLCRVFKVNLDTWEVVTVSEPLRLDHANGATFNTKTNEILVTHYNYMPKSISAVDPETLTITRTIELNREIRGIAYNAEKDQYAAIVKQNSDIVIYDANFEELAYYECVDPDMGRQCVSWDGKYLYLSYTGALRSKTAGSEIICCYDWSGNFCGVFRLNSYMELESACHINGETYISFYNDGGKFYRMDSSMIELLEPQN